MVFLFVPYAQLSTTLHTNKQAISLGIRITHPNCLLMFILAHKNDRKTFVNSSIIIQTMTELHLERWQSNIDSIEMGKSICVIDWHWVGGVLSSAGQYSGCAYRALLPSLAWSLTNSIWSISIVIAPDHSPAMHHDTALLPCDWSTGGMQPFDWLTERSTTIKYQWYQENSHKPNFSHKKVVMMHICEQNSDQISQGQKTIIN